MRQFEATCWIPRALEVDPVRVATGSGACEITITEAVGIGGSATLTGGEVAAVIEEPDDALPDDHVHARVREVTMLGVNHLIQVARFVSTRAVQIVPVLDERDFEHFLVFERTANTPRPLVPRAVAPRSLRITRTRLAVTDLSAALTPLAKLHSADFLWRAALEAACVGRTADAVVGARAALESAWVVTVEAAVAAHRQQATPELERVLAAHFAAAIDGRTGLKSRLEAYSEALLGESFSTRWGDPLWAQVLSTFQTRNLAAHGSGAVTLVQAFQVVGYIKQALDDIASVRARYP